MLVGLFTALNTIIIDQFSKYFVFEKVLDKYDMIVVSPNFNIVKAWNTGVSFSMFNDYGVYGVWGLTFVALLIVGFLLYWLKSEQKRFVQLALGFIIGGAIGNVIDRIRFGAVFDFLDVHVNGYHWPAFNFADANICIGAGMLIYYELFMKNKKNKTEKEK